MQQTTRNMELLDSKSTEFSASTTGCCGNALMTNWLGLWIIQKGNTFQAIGREESGYNWYCACRSYSCPLDYLMLPGNVNTVICYLWWCEKIWMGWRSKYNCLFELKKKNLNFKNLLFKIRHYLYKNNFFFGYFAKTYTVLMDINLFDPTFTCIY